MNRFAQSLIKSTLFQFKNVNLIGRQIFAFILTTNDDKIKKLFDLIKDVRYAMIVFIHVQWQVDNWDDTLWFFTKGSSPKVKEVKQNLDQVSVSYSDPNEMSFVSVSGLNDSDLILMKVTVDHGEYWDSPSSKMVQLYSMAKAAATKIPKGVDENEKIDIQK
ncbi:unnamed protein product [Rotaria sp. Silwood1]|nr:unnamed protein product [Rotaria sp. Silwood1]CAF0940014.1 unnamed protein product [Rotaria sp. Silwood1]CAF3358780.1 unnamed protein product [Rotaria sp. Silwood1]CAF3393921.1 unnamed protein product [Rotaria sp. Silwood1]CAF4598488.1 unnamed protein product [Rotaria sp. Silwood1]